MRLTIFKGNDELYHVVNMDTMCEVCAPFSKAADASSEVGQRVKALIAGDLRKAHLPYKVSA